MSHSEALCRLTVGDKRKDMIRWALRRAIDKVERNLKTDARGGTPVLFDHGLVPTPADARARTA
jgi:hypothetical protein